MKLLFAKKFVIPFESGIVVIKHWKIHNYIAKDRFKPTKYQDEKAQLDLDENNSYTKCIQSVYKMDTQVRLGKDSIGKVSIDKDSIGDDVPSDDDTPHHIPPILSFPTNKKDEVYNIYQTDIDDWSDIYPNVNVLQELKKMKGWLDANPKRRKTKSGLPRFINAWLSKEQDKPKRYDLTVEEIDETPKEKPSITYSQDEFDEIQAELRALLKK